MYIPDLTYIGQAELEMNLPQIIDALLAQYPGLGIEATDDYYASFDKAVAADLKLYFNSLYRLSAPSEPVSYTHLDVYKRQV